MNILSVDDVLVVRKIIKRVVEGMGGNLLEASSGIEAFSLMGNETKKIDLILLDLNMPQMDGFEFLDKMKKDDRYRHIPVIMVTNANEKGNVIKAIQAGAANYLCKPFSEEDLTKKIVECLGLGYEALLTKCLTGTLVRMLEFTTGTEVVETKISDEMSSLPAGNMFGQILLIGQKKAVVFVSMNTETAENVFRAASSKEHDPATPPASLMGSILENYISRVTEALSESNARTGLTIPMTFTGSIESNSYTVQSAKTFSTSRKYGSGGIEIDLRIIYFS